MLRDAEAFGEESRFDFEALALEFALLLVQIEEELALGARGSEADDAKVVEDELQEVRPDPVGGVGGDLHSPGGVESMHGLQQSEVSLLDQVEGIAPRAPVLHGDLDDEAQVGQYQTLRCLDVALLDPAPGKLLLFFA